MKSTTFRVSCIGLAMFFAYNTTAQNKKADYSKVPGTVIAHSPASSKKYLFAPSIVILLNGDYVAKTVKSPNNLYFKSTDKGKTWKLLSESKASWGSKLFVFKEDLYCIGNSYGGLAIIKSTDGKSAVLKPIV